MDESTITAAGLRVMKLLVGKPPQAVGDLIRATGVTRTAVAEQLNELVAAGFVARTTQRQPGPGRPRHLFSATNAALSLLFASNQPLVVPAIWRAIEDVGGAELTRKIVRKVGRIMAEHYSSRITAKSPKERLERFIDLLREEGGLLDLVSRNGHVTIHKRSCPFMAMLDDKRTVCALDLELMTAVVGRAVRRTACRHDGDPCCVIQIGPES